MTEGDYKTLSLVWYTGDTAPYMVLVDDNAYVVHSAVSVVSTPICRPSVSNENFTIGFFNGLSNLAFLAVTLNNNQTFDLVPAYVAYPIGVYEWQISYTPSSKRQSTPVGTFPSSGSRLFGNTAMTVYVFTSTIIALAQRGTLGAPHPPSVIDSSNA